MTLLFRDEPDGEPGVFLVRRDGTATRVAYVPAGQQPTEQQMIRIETAWFTSARYPEPISAMHYLRALGPKPMRVVPKDVTGLPPDLGFADLPPVPAWDSEP